MNPVSLSPLRILGVAAVSLAASRGSVQKGERRRAVVVTGLVDGFGFR
jgi:hypothetical protein